MWRLRSSRSCDREVIESMGARSIFHLFKCLQTLRLYANIALRVIKATEELPSLASSGNTFSSALKENLQKDSVPLIKP